MPTYLNKSARYREDFGPPISDPSVITISDPPKDTESIVLVIMWVTIAWLIVTVLIGTRPHHRR